MKRLTIKPVTESIQKYGDSNLLAIEAEKASRALDIGRKTGLFYVPGVVNFDADTGILEFEKLNGLSTLLDLAIRNDKRLPELFEKTGRALAVIHEQLILPDRMKHKLPAEWMDSSNDNVFIHGDFVTVNICFQEHPERLVVLDFSAAPLLGRTPTFGSRYFDILWFVNSIFSGVPYKRIFNWDAETMSAAFLNGYTKGTSDIKLDKLKDYVPKICSLQKKNCRYLLKRQASPVRAAAYAFCQIIMKPRLRTFLNNFEF
jgi:tRNA A-37 threonylcarbamoyl transferase component Bud32